MALGLHPCQALVEALAGVGLEGRPGLAREDGVAAEVEGRFEAGRVELAAGEGAEQALAVGGRRESEGPAEVACGAVDGEGVEAAVIEDLLARDGAGGGELGVQNRSCDPKQWSALTATQPTNETALYFASFNADTITAPLLASQIITVNDAPGSQIQPAIDNDDTGNILMTYFTTENHTGDNHYQIFGIARTSSGGPLTAAAALDPNAYPNGFTGDYHDNFYFTFPLAMGGSLWTTTWSRNSGGFDAMISGVK